MKKFTNRRQEEGEEYKVEDLVLLSTKDLKWQMKCSDLVWDDLTTLLVWVDKENLIEFSFDCHILLIYILYLLLFIKSYASLLSHSLIKWKEKEKKNK